MNEKNYINPVQVPDPLSKKENVLRLQSRKMTNSYNNAEQFHIFNLNLSFKL